MRWVDAARVGDPRQALITDIDEARRAADWARDLARHERMARGRRVCPPKTYDDEAGDELEEIRALEQMLAEAYKEE